jgi:hypothetical protein
MTDFDASFARLQARVETQKAERQRKWARIQNEAPQIADDLIEIKRELGKPAKVWVWIGDERIL